MPKVTGGVYCVKGDWGVYWIVTGDRGVYCSVKGDYCLNTIFQKLHFSKSHFCETLQEHMTVIFLQPKSRKNCCKNFENRFTSKIIMPKEYFE